jgi:hypothetical protein
MYGGPLYAHDIVTLKKIVSVQKWQKSFVSGCISGITNHSLTHTRTHMTAFTKECLLYKTTYATVLKNLKSNELHY